MSCVEHRAIILTAWNSGEGHLPQDTKFTRALIFATQLFGNSLISSIIDTGQYSTFVVTSAGDKQGREGDLEHRRKQEQFVRFLEEQRRHATEGANSLKWVQIAYGEDENDSPATIENDSNVSYTNGV